LVSSSDGVRARNKAKTGGEDHNHGKRKTTAKPDIGICGLEENGGRSKGGKEKRTRGKDHGDDDDPYLMVGQEKQGEEDGICVKSRYSQ